MQAHTLAKNVGKDLTKMSRILYANGCSWTAGNGIDSDPAISHRSPADKAKEMVRKAWPAVLASKLGAEFINESAGGGSNARMMRMTCDFVRKFPADQRDDLLVVLGWTSSERDEIHVSYGKQRRWATFNGFQKFSTQWFGAENAFPRNVLHDLDKYHEFHIKYVLDEQVCVERYLREVWMMKNILENLGIKYLFFSSIGGLIYPGSSYDPWVMHPNECSVLDDPRMVGMYDGMSMQLYCMINQIPLSPCVHPMIEGHEKWATHLHDAYNKCYGASNK